MAIQWGVMSPEDDRIHPVASHAQAWALSATWGGDHPDLAVIVARTGPDADWVTSDGVTYSDPALVGTDADVDSMADPDNAAWVLGHVAALAVTDPAAALVLTALRHEAVAHGHDIEED